MWDGVHELWPKEIIGCFCFFGCRYLFGVFMGYFLFGVILCSTLGFIYPEGNT